MDKEYAEYLLKKTRENYNLTANEFSETRKVVWPELKFLFDYVREGEKVLDLGCGNGRYYEFLKEKNIEYVGVDNSQELIKIAKEKYPDVNFKIADALDLPFSDNYFDKIYSIAVFHHIPSREFRIKFLKEAMRVLKPEGILFLTTWKFHRKKEIFYLIKYTILKILGKSKLDFKDVFEPWQNKIERYYHWFSGKELVDLAKEAGFKIKEIGIIKNKESNRRNTYLIAEKFPSL